MALSKSTIKAAMQAIYKEVDSKNPNSDIETIQNLSADKMADWVIDAIKSMTITIPSGAITILNADGSAGSNPNTIILTGVIS